MNHYETLAQILGVSPDALRALDETMASRTGTAGVMQRVHEENEMRIAKTLAAIGLARTADASEVREALMKTIAEHESQLVRYLATVSGASEFDKAANLSRRIARIGKGFFLKKSYGADILKKSEPKNLLAFLGYDSVDTLLGKHDVTEIFSALRFIESNEWMHDTFEKGYSAFTAADFEERDVEVKVLGPEWHEIAKKFVEKKHHNVSHLKEFGVIFLNPISEDVRGKFVRDFALLLHYFHEIDFYSKLFRAYSGRADFPMHLKALLRGDVPEAAEAKEGTWLIVQRYLWKDDPKDPRLFLPRVNPESMHWLRGERDLATLGAELPELDLELWGNLDWVGSLFDHGNETVVSFDLEDNAMSEVAKAEGKSDSFNYHQREALWTKLFFEYAGGEERAEKLLVENYEKKAVTF